jgi:hypothetical protein
VTGSGQSPLSPHSGPEHDITTLWWVMFGVSCVGLALVAFFTWIFIVFLAGSADRIFVLFGLSYEGQVWALRLLVFVLPVVALVVTKRVCEELLRGEVVEVRRKLVEAEQVI